MGQVKDSFKIAFGAEVRRLRKQKQMTQEQLASVLGISKSGVCLIENGRRLPALHRYGDFAAALGKEPEDLVKAAYAQN
jgi:transcriptional regulator with XRE-family HTH domain